MSSSMGGLDPSFRPYVEQLLQVARNAGFQPRVTSTRRSRREQEALYARWKAGRNPYPVAVPGTSDHERGMAFDLVSLDNAPLGALWKSWGGRWSPSDEVHFAAPR